jgi:cytochrome c556
MQFSIASKISVLILSALSLLFSVTAYAAGEGHDHGETSEAAKFRHTVMEAMGNHFAAVALIFTGRVDMPDDLQVHADALAATAATVGGLFPAGSEGGDALPAIWEEPDKVAAASKDAADATAALASAIQGGNKGDIAKAFKAAGGSCKGCHEDYKEEDD